MGASRFDRRHRGVCASRVPRMPHARTRERGRQPDRALPGFADRPARGASPPDPGTSANGRSREVPRACPAAGLPAGVRTRRLRSTQRPRRHAALTTRLSPRDEAPQMLEVDPPAGESWASEGILGARSAGDRRARKLIAFAARAGCSLLPPPFARSICRYSSETYLRTLLEARKPHLGSDTLLHMLLRE